MSESTPPQKSKVPSAAHTPSSGERRRKHGTPFSLSYDRHARQHALDAIKRRAQNSPPKSPFRSVPRTRHHHPLPLASRLQFGPPCNDAKDDSVDDDDVLSVARQLAVLERGKSCHQISPIPPNTNRTNELSIRQMPSLDSESTATSNVADDQSRRCLRRAPAGRHQRTHNSNSSPTTKRIYCKFKHHYRRRSRALATWCFPSRL